MTRLGVALAAALFLFISWVTPAGAQVNLEVGPGEAVCEKDGPRCLVRREDVAKQNAKLQEAADALRAQEGVIALLEGELKRLRAIKGCAKLEVLPKPTLPNARGS